VVDQATDRLPLRRTATFKRRRAGRRLNTSGRIDILAPSGRILWTYGPATGPGALDRPSLAAQLPNGNIAATDDWHYRVVVIDQASKRIVWQYGHDGSPGSAPAYLRKPDGLDLLP